MVTTTSPFGQQFLHHGFQRDTASNITHQTSGAQIRTAHSNTDATVASRDTHNIAARLNNTSKTNNTKSRNQHSSLPTQIKVNLLDKLLTGYQDRQYIIDGFTNGFMIDFTGKEDPLSSTNSQSAYIYHDVVDEKLKNETFLGRVAGPFDTPPFINFKSSPLAVREKAEKGKYRLLHNLSFPYNHQSVNANIPKESCHVQYATIKDAIQVIQTYGTSTFMAKTDIADAFRIIPLHPSQYHLTGFYWKGYWYDKCLPMGCSQSCKIFERFSDCLQWILQTKFNIQSIKLLDDFLFLAPSIDQCQTYLTTFCELCEQLDIPIAYKKTMGPTKAITFLGIQLDSDQMKACLPQDKIKKYHSEIKHYSKKNKVTLRELKSTIGMLQFATSVITCGRPFLRRLYDLTMQANKPYHMVTLNRQAKADLATWSSFLSAYNGISLISPHNIVDSQVCHLYSDASKQGYGVTFQSSWFQGTWPERWRAFDITVLELYPIFMAVNIFSETLSHHRVVFHCDNIAIVAVINKQTSKSNHIMDIIRPFVLTLLKHDIVFSAVHIPGRHNVICDILSRQVVTPSILQTYGMEPSPVHIPTHLLPGNFLVT